MRALLVFFALGALLFAGKRALERVAQSPLRQLEVVVKDGTDAAQLERAIDEAMLVEHAVAAGGALVDPVVREQLLSNMRGRSPGAAASAPRDDAALLERALALGLHRADIVTRERLVFQAEQLLMAGAVSLSVRDDQLAEYLRAHAERYQQTPRLSFEQLTVSRARHGADLPRAARELAQQLAQHGDDPTGLGDPTLLSRSWSRSTASALDARFGEDFAAAIARCAPRFWCGPVASSYGLHLVRVSESLPAKLPALASVRERVLADYRHDHRFELLRERLRALRGTYRVHVRRLHA